MLNTVPFVPEMLGRGADIQSIIYRPKLLATLGVNGDSPPKIASIDNCVTTRPFQATQGTDANKPEYIAGSGMLVQNTGGVSCGMSIPAESFLSDFHGFYIAFTVDWAQTSTGDHVIWALGGTATSNGQRWCYIGLKGINSTSGELTVQWYSGGVANDATFTIGNGSHTIVSTTRTDASTSVAVTTIDGAPEGTGGMSASVGTNVMPYMLRTGAATGLLGDHPAITSDLYCVIHELGMVPNRLTAAEMQLLHGYAARESTDGATLLHASCPWKSTPPVITQAVLTDKSKAFNQIIAPQAIVEASTRFNTGWYDTILDLTGWEKAYEVNLDSLSKITDPYEGVGPLWVGVEADTTATAWKGYSDLASYCDIDPGDATATRFKVSRATASGAPKFNSIHAQTMNADGSRGFADYLQNVYAEVEYGLPDAPGYDVNYASLRAAPVWYRSANRYSDRTQPSVEIDPIEFYSNNNSEARRAHLTGLQHEASILSAGYQTSSWRTPSQLIGAGLSSGSAGSPAYDFEDGAGWAVGSTKGHWDNTIRVLGFCFNPITLKSQTWLGAYESGNLVRRLVSQRDTPAQWFAHRYYAIIGWLEAIDNLASSDVGPYYMRVRRVTYWRRPT